MITCDFVTCKANVSTCMCVFICIDELCGSLKSSFFCSLFSMDGDFAPMVELVMLRKKHRFLFVIDDVSCFFPPPKILV